MIDSSAIGERIRRTREACFLTQHRMAVLIGDTVTQSVVSRWEGGLVTPRTEHIASIAQVLGCSADYLLFGTPRKIEATERKRQTMY